MSFFSATKRPEFEVPVTITLSANDWGVLTSAVIVGEAIANPGSPGWAEVRAVREKVDEQIMTALDAV